MPLRPDEVKTFDQLHSYGMKFGYRRTIGGHLRQAHWNGLSFQKDGTVKYMRNGAVVAQNVTPEGMAVLIKLLGKDEAGN